MKIGDQHFVDMFVFVCSFNLLCQCCCNFQIEMYDNGIINMNKNFVLWNKRLKQFSVFAKQIKNEMEYVFKNKFKLIDFWSVIFLL